MLSKIFLCLAGFFAYLLYEIGHRLGFWTKVRLVDESLMVYRGEIVELWLCSREITALARTAGCRLRGVRAVVARGQQSRENTAGIARRLLFGIEPERYHLLLFRVVSSVNDITAEVSPGLLVPHACGYFSSWHKSSVLFIATDI